MSFSEENTGEGALSLWFTIRQVSPLISCQLDMDYAQLYISPMGGGVEDIGASGIDLRLKKRYPQEIAYRQSEGGDPVYDDDQVFLTLYTGDGPGTLYPRATTNWWNNPMAYVFETSAESYFPLNPNIEEHHFLITGSDTQGGPYGGQAYVDGVLWTNAYDKLAAHPLQPLSIGSFARVEYAPDSFQDYFKIHNHFYLGRNVNSNYRRGFHDSQLHIRGCNSYHDGCIDRVWISNVYVPENKLVLFRTPQGYPAPMGPNGEVQIEEEGDPHTPLVWLTNGDLLTNLGTLGNPTGLTFPCTEEGEEAALVPVTVGFTVNSVAVTEGEDLVAVLHVERRGWRPGEIVSVDYATADGSAEAGEDYTETTGTLTFGENDGCLEIEIPITNDAEYEAAIEDFTLTLSNPVNCILRVGEDEATVFISSEDPHAGIVQFVDTVASVVEDEEEKIIQVSRTVSDAGTAEVSYSIVPGSAEATDDYTPVSGTLTWLDGDSANKQIVIPIIVDGVTEGDEDFTVVLSDPVGTTILGPNDECLVTIQDAAYGTSATEYSGSSSKSVSVGQFAAFDSTQIAVGGWIYFVALPDALTSWELFRLGTLDNAGRTQIFLLADGTVQAGVTKVGGSQGPLLTSTLALTALGWHEWLFSCDLNVANSGRLHIWRADDVPETAQDTTGSHYGGQINLNSAAGTCMWAPHDATDLPYVLSEIYAKDTFFNLSSAPEIAKFRLNGRPRPLGTPGGSGVAVGAQVYAPSGNPNVNLGTMAAFTSTGASAWGGPFP